MKSSGAAKRRGGGRLFATAVGGGLGMCLASLLVSGQRPSGTGTHHWRGFPRSYVFSWQDLAGEDVRSGINAFYFVQNWVLWTAAAAAMLLLLRRLRAHPGSRGREGH